MDTKTNKNQNGSLFLIDGANAYYRAFHAIRGGMTAPDGTPTNALYGLARMTLQLFKKFEPQRLVYLFDAPGPTFRDKMFPAYKAQRSPMPEELAVQLPLMYEMLELLGIPQLAMPGFEADDLIGSMAVRLASRFKEVWIVSSDKDLMQVVGDNIYQYDAMNDRTFDAAGVHEKWGVSPERIVDLLGLMGDSSDNIPGVPGVGKIGAAKLIGEFGSMEELLNNLDRLKEGSKQQQNLREFAQQGRDSKILATLKLDVEIPGEEEMISSAPRVSAQWQEFVDRVGFGRIGYELVAHFGQDNALEPAAVREPVEPFNWQWEVLSDAGLDKTLAGLTQPIVFDLETTGLDPHTALILGVALADNGKNGLYLPVVEGKLPEAMVAWLADESIAKAGQNLKYDVSVLLANGYEVGGIRHDTMIAHALTHPQARTHKLDAISQEMLGHTMIPFTDVTGDTLDFGAVSLEKAAEYASEDAVVCKELLDRLLPELAQQKQQDLYEKVEMPLVKILAQLQLHGILLDRKRLAEISHDLQIQLDDLIGRIEEMVGESFNLNSTQQLSDLLFGRLGLSSKGIKKTKAGTYSTRAEVLEKLQDEHPIVPLMLEYRKLEKLRNTYLEPMPTLIHSKTGRIHSSFHQIGAATGRMSSSDPNLQNIPVRDEWGRKIRSAFVAADGYTLVSADYSQIELRLFAHITDDPGLISAFGSGEDIHSRTAEQMFGLLPGMVSAEERRRAKTLNFGLLYGMGARRLAGELDIRIKEASVLIETYFKQFPRIRAGMDEILEEARSTGMVRTILGRIRPAVEVNSSRAMDRARAERMAVNAPIQGSAADLMKLSMIAVDTLIRSQFPGVRMLLQVHDELVLEVPEGDVEQFVPLLKSTMEQVTALKVPLVVDVGTGKDWAEAH